MPVRSLACLAVILLAVAAQPAVAQLSGVYTVDNSAPTGGTNYNTLAEAATALGAGVSGPVVFNIQTGTGPYTGFGITGPVAGASATNTIVFTPGVGQTPVISGPAAGNVQTIKLGTANTAGTGPSYIQLVGLTVTGAPSGAGILTAGCSNILVQYCTVFSCGAGIYFASTTNSTVEDCEVYAVANTCGSPGSASYSGGISVYYTSTNCTVQRNNVHDCTGAGIFIGSGSSASVPTGTVVINNFISNTPGTTTYLAGGLCLRRADTCTIANNSINMPAGTANAGIYTSGTPNIPTNISNNIVGHAGTGPCFRFEATTTPVPTYFDDNVYDNVGGGPVGMVAATPYATLALWQAVTTPSLAGKEINTVVGGAGFVSATDLHITGASAGFLNGTVVAVVVDDIDGQVRTATRCRGADETTGVGIFANFTATPTTGPAALMVTFTDATFTSDPGGLTGWLWDFENDGIVDSTLQNPTHTYVVPGTYTVALTATDALNGSSTKTRTNYITVTPYLLDVQTTAGLGDLTIIGVPSIGVPTATTGYLFFSFTPAATVGGGPAFGLIPDTYFWAIAMMPASVGSILHWIVTPGLFPNVPLVVPPGALLSLVGLTADFVQVDLTASLTIANISNVDRVTF